MPDTIVFPDVEGIVKSWAVTALHALEGMGDVAGYVRPPTTLPARFFTVRRAGGVADTLVTDSPRLQVVCWGADDPDAYAIAANLRGLLLYQLPRTTAGGAFIYRVSEFGGPVPTPDPETGRSRYLFTITIRLRGAQQ